MNVQLPQARELVVLANELGDERSLAWLQPAAAAEALRAGDHAIAAGFVIEAMVAARAIASWNWSAVSLTQLVQLGAAERDDEKAAWLHGIASGHLELLRPGLPPHAVTDYEGAIASLRERLGEERFEIVAGSAALLSIEDAHADAVAYAQSIVDRSRGQADGAAAPDRSPLTDRETQVIDRLVAGDRNKDIAGRLGISPKTVMHHTSSIYRKLGVRGRSEAVAWALRGPAPRPPQEAADSPNKIKPPTT